MEYRELKNGCKASLLGYGCMRFPTLANGEIDEAEAEKLLDKAYASGVTYYDTAYPYHGGRSEKFVGRVMSKYNRDTFYLATKLPCWKVHSKEDAVAIFNEQLENLRTDHIDFYLLHALDKGRFDEMVKLGVVEMFEEYKAKGLIRNYGFSFHDDYNAFEKIINYRDWDFCQIQFNYIDKDTQATVKGVELAEKKGIPLVIMEPVKGGSLANVPDEIMDIVKPYRPDYTPSAWALSWVGTFKNVKVILSGMTKMSQLDDNLKTFNAFKPLSDEEMKAIDKVKEEILNRAMNGCTGCRYCMPCPMGVNIPRNFAAWNNYHRFNNAGELSWTLSEMKQEELPYACVKCGRCETLCPQKLSIRDDLVKAGEEFKQFLK